MSNTVKRTPKTLREAEAAARAHPLVGAILAAEDRPYEDVEVPEWGGITIRIRGASGAVLDAHEARMFKLRTAGDEMVAQIADNYRADFLARCLYDPDTDEPLPITAQQLGQKAGRVVARLFATARRLSGQGPNGPDVEAAEGNSAADQSGSSTTG